MQRGRTISMSEAFMRRATLTFLVLFIAETSAYAQSWTVDASVSSTEEQTSYQVSGDVLDPAEEGLDGSAMNAKVGVFIYEDSDSICETATEITVILSISLRRGRDIGLEAQLERQGASWVLPERRNPKLSYHARDGWLSYREYTNRQTSSKTEIKVDKFECVGDRVNLILYFSGRLKLKDGNGPDVLMVSGTTRSPPLVFKS